jgi:hypothetical protein
LIGMLRQSLTQLPAKAYAQQCCSEWSIDRDNKNPPDGKTGGSRSNLPRG